jgi:hypothetical protein
MDINLACNKRAKNKTAIMFLLLLAVPPIISCQEKSVSISRDPFLLFYFRKENKLCRILGIRGGKIPLWNWL